MRTISLERLHSRRLTLAAVALFAVCAALALTAARASAYTEGWYCGEPHAPRLILPGIKCTHSVHHDIETLEGDIDSAFPAEKNLCVGAKANSDGSGGDTLAFVCTNYETVNYAITSANPSGAWGYAALKNEGGGSLYAQGYLWAFV